MVSRVIILTLGFDEKFAIRALMRTAPLKDDEVMIIIPTQKNERAEKALTSLKKFCEIIESIMFEVVEVPVNEPELAIATIYKVLSRKLRSEKRLQLNLSGGMRALILETLAATLAAASHIPDIKIEVELENLSGVAEFKLDHFRLSPLGSLDLNILASIKKLEDVHMYATLDMITSETKMPRSTVYRRLLTLTKRGYVKLEKQGRKILYLLTDLGRMWA
jgi:CRISPR-associated protein Csa3